MADPIQGFKLSFSHDIVYIFPDIAFSVINGKARFGFAFWCNGSWLGAGVVDVPKVDLSKEAKTRAILIALIETKARGFRRVHILSDALKVA